MKTAMKTAIKIICILLVIAMILLTILVINPEYRFRKNRDSLAFEAFAYTDTAKDRIHFLNTGSSDAILLESDGKFAMIDAGEDNDNPRGFKSLDLEGYEDRVLEYIKKVAADENGKVTLDFVLGTHSHSDHIGGFDTIISDDDITVNRAYLKQYDSSKIDTYEVERWDNQEVYDQMVDALNAKNVPIISQVDETPFELGNFTITVFNGDDPETDEKVGENDNSFGVLVEKNGTRVFLSGDIDNKTGDEERLGEKIGKVNLLKVGHHSYTQSTSSEWVKALMPDTCVVTNKYSLVNKTTLYRIERIAGSTVLITGQENGIVAEIGDNGSITYYNDIH